ncbi:MAG: cell surface protein [Verrucomicrobiales bacterium]|nr:cell surface protein [Verrucomicrobiales bacterium]
MKKIILCFSQISIVFCLGQSLLLQARTWRVDDDRLQKPSADFTTLADAVAVARDGDDIVVYPGVYDAAVAVTNSIDILGPKQGKDGRSRSGKETEEAILTAPAGQHLVLSANGIKLGGFLIRIPTQTFPQDGRMGVVLDAAFSGFQVSNNIFDHSGVEANSSGAERSVVSRNGFVNDGQFNGIFATAAQNVLVEKNSFQDAPVWFSSSSRITISENRCRGPAGQDETATFHLRHCTNALIAANKFSARATLGLTQLVATRATDNIFSTGFIWITLVNNDLTVDHNRFANCPYGILLSNEGPGPTGALIRSNEIEDGEVGILVGGDAYSNMIENNNVADNQIGIVVGSSEESFIAPNIIRNNEVRGNSIIDCLDYTVGTYTSGTANIWTNNEGSRCSPHGICHD